MPAILPVVGQPDPIRTIKQVVLDAVTSEHTKRAYDRALSDFLAWYRREGSPRLDRALVQRYIALLREQGMQIGNVNQRLCALRKLAREAAENGALDEQLARGIEGITGIRQEGTRTGNWLTKQQAQALLDAPDLSTRKGVRDRAILAVLIGCGLRRSELTSLTWQHIQQREESWAIVDLVGKRNKLRTVVMPNWVKVALDDWVEVAPVETGPLFRAVNKGGAVSNGRLSSQAVRDVVVEYSSGLHLKQKRIAPHDLRRTFGKLAHKGGVDLEQLRLNMGHESLDTLLLYLGSELEFTNPPGDSFGLVIRRRHELRLGGLEK